MNKVDNILNQIIRIFYEAFKQELNKVGIMSPEEIKPEYNIWNDFPGVLADFQHLDWYFIMEIEDMYDLRKKQKINDFRSNDNIRTFMSIALFLANETS